MKTQGIVTDSDTEKELQAWQQARENPVDEERLRQQYKNRRNNAQGNIGRVQDVRAAQYSRDRQNTRAVPCDKQESQDGRIYRTF